jgi:SynChlorMet cassette radical SAM/SPASM protein ScmF
MLEPDVLRHAIEQALPLGLTSLKWTGGEPTLHPHFSEMLQMQTEFGLTGAVETNGMLVTLPLAELMREARVEQVSVSLDSADAAIHDAIRGVAGGFERTIKGVTNLVSAGFRPELILTLQRANSPGLTDYFALAEQLGVCSVKLNVMQPVLRGGQLLVEGGGLSVGEILAIAESLSHQPSGTSTCPVRLDLPLAFRPLSKVISGEHAGVCNIHNIIGLLPNGGYALCGVGQHVAELCMGDAQTSSLPEVWASHPVLQKIRQELPGRLSGICSHCLMKNACLGSCVATNYHLSGELLAPYWLCEQAEAQGLFPESRRL